jgi:3-oxoacyl-ACP reductase-like protein
MSGGETGAADLEKLEDALASIPDSPLTGWYNRVRQPGEGVDTVAAAIRFHDSGIEKVGIYELRGAHEIYSPWADVVLHTDTQAFASKDEFREQVRKVARERLSG